MKTALKLVVVVGARPQFIKAAAFSRAIRLARAAGHAVEEVLIHTGQHYDHMLSQSFFDELQITPPAVNLGVGSGRHGQQTAKMLEGLESEFIESKPDWVVVFGDTNSTAAAALAAAKLNIPVAHIEAGLREHDRRIPEEVNKLVTDHLSDLCFAPTNEGMENLSREGLGDRAHLVGDIMLDTTVWQLSTLTEAEIDATLAKFELKKDGFILATTHRAATRADAEKLNAVFEALHAMPLPTLLPLHPSTKASLESHGLTHQAESDDVLRVVDPISYREILALLSCCRAVVTDSGGLIKESYFFKKPCITLDNQTEWVETLIGGWNVIAGADKDKILAAEPLRQPDPEAHQADAFGTGRTAQDVLDAILAEQERRHAL